MSEQDHDDGQVVDARVPQGAFTVNTMLKAQLKKVKDVVAEDMSKFKEKKAYRLKKIPDAAYFINYIGVDPNSGLPLALGFVVTTGGHSPQAMLLRDLKPEEVFF
ncbi:hypothetical protein D3C78_1570530 [compost metagenome]